MLKKPLSPLDSEGGAGQQGNIVNDCLTNPANRHGDQHMRTSSTLIAAAVIGSALFASGPASAKGACFNKAAEGTNTDTKGAQFQAYEAILQSFDWGAWSSWMASGTTPGYKISPAKYRCSPGGIGVKCIAQATICKT